MALPRDRVSTHPRIIKPPHPPSIHLPSCVKSHIGMISAIWDACISCHVSDSPHLHRHSPSCEYQKTRSMALGFGGLTPWSPSPPQPSRVRGLPRDSDSSPSSRQPRAVARTLALRNPPSLYAAKLPSYLNHRSMTPSSMIPPRRYEVKGLGSRGGGLRTGRSHGLGRDLCVSSAARWAGSSSCYSSCYRIPILIL